MCWGKKSWKHSCGPDPVCKRGWGVPTTFIVEYTVSNPLPIKENAIYMDGSKSTMLNVYFIAKTYNELN